MTSKSGAMCVLLSIVWLVARAVKIGTQPCSSLNISCRPQRACVIEVTQQLQYINDTATRRENGRRAPSSDLFATLQQLFRNRGTSASASASCEARGVVVASSTPPIDVRCETARVRLRRPPRRSRRGVTPRREALRPQDVRRADLGLAEHPLLLPECWLQREPQDGPGQLRGQLVPRGDGDDHSAKRGNAS